jgi:uncharacterized membrane protein YfcA
MSAFHLTHWQWTLAVLGGICVGLSKSGIVGFGMPTVLLMAMALPPRESTGVVLPLLIAGDIFGVATFRKFAIWSHIRRMFLPTMIGIIIGFYFMKTIPDSHFGKVIGTIVLALLALQLLRKSEGILARMPHTKRFGWLMGGVAGLTTMLANAAGPFISIYFLLLNIPKYEFVGTIAWFFLIFNVIKIPFSYELGLLNGGSLQFDLLLLPAVALGFIIGKLTIDRISQVFFERMILIFTGLVAIKLILF